MIFVAFNLLYSLFRGLLSCLGHRCLLLSLLRRWFL